MSLFPQTRMRRLRYHPGVRRLVRETRVHPDQLIYPVFLVPGQGVRNEIRSMPGQSQLSVDAAVDDRRADRRDPDGVGEDFRSAARDGAAFEEAVEGPECLGLVREAAQDSEEDDEADQADREGGAPRVSEAESADR